MKKLLLTLCFVIVFVVFALNVRAVGTSAELIYDIENFTLTETEIKFTGWAFLLNRHNNKSNATITVTAKGDNGKHLNASIERNDSLNSSLYIANCIKCNYSSNTNPGKCCQTHDNATCSSSNNQSACRYDDAAFTATFKIGDILSTIGDDATITFKISVKVDNESKEDNIAVAKKNAHYIQTLSYIDAGGNTKEINVEVSGLGTTATTRVAEGRVLTDVSASHKYGGTFYWGKNETFNIIASGKSTNSNYPDITMYNLDFKIGEKTEKSSSNMSNNINNPYVTYRTCESTTTPKSGTYLCGAAFPGNDDSGWALASWVQVDGYVKLKFKSDTPRNTCNVDEEEDIPNKLNCQDGENFEYNETGIFSNDAIERVISYSTDTNSEYQKRTKINHKKDLVTGTCDKDINEILKTTDGNDSIFQKGEGGFHINDIDLYSGGGFNFTASYTGTIYYTLCNNELKYELTEQYDRCPKVEKKSSFTTFSHSGFDMYVYTYDYTGIVDSGEEAGRSTYIGNGKCQYTVTENIETFHYEIVSHYVKTWKTGCSGKTVYNAPPDCLGDNYDYVSQGTSSNTISPYGTITTESFCEEISVGNEFGISMDGTCKYKINSEDAGDCSSDEKDAFAKYMADKYLQTAPFDNRAKTEVEDPNSVTATNPVSYGSWSNNYQKEEYWYPYSNGADGYYNEILDYDLEFEPQTACIDRRTANVRYTNGSCDLNKEIDGDMLIYTPLKQKEEDPFMVYVNIEELSMTLSKWMSWPLTYECGANCQQRLYNIDGNDISYKFIYRPINLKNAFPTVVNANRQVGYNWMSLVYNYSSDYSKLVEHGRDKDYNNLEYTIKLDKNTISQIKNDYDSKYNNMITIALSNDGTNLNVGRSRVLAELNVFNKKTNNYNALGECTSACWPSSGYFSSGD